MITPADPLDEAPEGYSIAAAERTTGVSKDTLRVWERRYGFPQPHRNERGERVYPAEQVARLRIIRRVLDGGMRPGKAFALNAPDLDAAASRPCDAQPANAAHEHALSLLKAHRVADLRRELHQVLVTNGLSHFITDTAAPLAKLVGDAWMRGEVQVHEEHLFTEQLQSVLRQALSQLVPTGAPKVLLTTLPGEQHGVALLMAEAALALTGAECVQLGTETPAADVVAAARAHHVDVVALSFSIRYPLVPMRKELRLLRSMLPGDIELWCGGSGVPRLRRNPPQDVRVFAALNGVGAAVAALRVARSQS
jgi:MerR family transcriptional regulator, light-induced transcriptional regulator